MRFLRTLQQRVVVFFNASLQDLAKYCFDLSRSTLIAAIVYLAFVEKQSASINAVLLIVSSMLLLLLAMVFNFKGRD